MVQKSDKNRRKVIIHHVDGRKVKGFVQFTGKGGGIKTVTMSPKTRRKPARKSFKKRKSK